MKTRRNSIWTVAALASLPMAGCGPALQLTFEMMRHSSSHAQVEPPPEPPAAASTWTLAEAPRRTGPESTPAK